MDTSSKLLKINTKYTIMTFEVYRNCLIVNFMRIRLILSVQYGIIRC